MIWLQVYILGFAIILACICALRWMKVHEDKDDRALPSGCLAAAVAFAAIWPLLLFAILVAGVIAETEETIRRHRRQRPRS